MKVNDKDEKSGRVEEALPSRNLAVNTLHPGIRDHSKDTTKQLQLLGLPVDVLQCIVNHVSHTNDLTNLALVHSALHQLVIPHIYSRFDIVWPEANPTVETRVGVDALTYGLATLVMTHDVLGETMSQETSCINCDHCKQNSIQRSLLQSRLSPVRVRRGNYFAQHTRKFSLGNGPMDWVTEYLITKESGKMLGTLAALALGKMRNLEAFVWDMPTGVLRDVWLALASLGNRQDGQQCRLEKVWVRWHDNRDNTSGPATNHSNLPALSSTSSRFNIPAYPSVEFPSFSVLPPLKSISVLDIDEVSYAEELSLLLERSLDRLQELRIGVAYHAQREVPFRPLEDRTVVPPPISTEDGQQRPGGLLGILVNQFSPLSTSPTRNEPSAATSSYTGQVNHPRDFKGLGNAHLHSASNDSVAELGHLLETQHVHTETETLEKKEAGQIVADPCRASISSRKMKLQILEMERVYLTIPVLSRAIDWSRLESLTLLGCSNHEQLWKALRRIFTPASVRNRSSMYTTSSTPTHGRRNSILYNDTDVSEYKLKLHRLHIDTVSKAFLSFVRDTLAPNTLEYLFLQETVAYRSTVTIDDIYRCAIRRHRYSLRKLLIDSEIKDKSHRDANDVSWRRWIDHKDLLTCITNGKTQLREVSIAIDYKNWHYFLQRLPNATSLRSLHISHIADHPSGRQLEPKDVAMQVLNIIALRPEMQLCYLGLEKKCFEILEFKANAARRDSMMEYNGIGHNANIIGITTHTVVEEDEEDEEEDEDMHDDGVHFQNGGYSAGLDGLDEEDQGWESGSQHSSSESDGENEEDDASAGQKVYFDLREILFYDDKVSIFKARHGKL